jgi:hypothetical protein
MKMTGVQEAIEVSKYAAMINHIRNNRIEYLLLVGLLHLVGFTNKAYAQVSGVCF